jgi:hypothetical protein
MATSKQQTNPPPKEATGNWEEIAMLTLAESLAIDGEDLPMGHGSEKSKWQGKRIELIHGMKFWRSDRRIHELLVCDGGGDMSAYHDRAET